MLSVSIHDSLHTLPHSRSETGEFPCFFFLLFFFLAEMNTWQDKCMHGMEGCVLFSGVSIFDILEIC